MAKVSQASAAVQSVRQRGLSLIGLFLVGLIVVGLIALGFKVVPAVVEYIAIERAVQKIKNEGSTVPAIRGGVRPPCDDRRHHVDQEH